MVCFNVPANYTVDAKVKKTVTDHEKQRVIVALCINPFGNKLTLFNNLKRKTIPKNIIVRVRLIDGRQLILWNVLPRISG
jgi:hypothetical protein